VLDSLRRQIGKRPLSRVSVFVDGDRVVAWDGQTRWQPESGQFLFNFDAGQVVRRASQVAKLPSSERPRLPELTAEEWCELAIEIEERSPLEAKAAYHHALDIDPGNATARINLGRMLHAEGTLAGAEAHYREALRREPSSAIAWYNLGVLLEDQSQQDEAIAAYERAVRADGQLAEPSSGGCRRGADVRRPDTARRRRHLGLQLPRLARALLPGGSARVEDARLLRPHPRHGGDQQHLLSPADRGAARGVGR
jgi:tetratricopeptide (TPR) repeat protein